MKTFKGDTKHLFCVCYTPENNKQHIEKWDTFYDDQVDREISAFFQKKGLDEINRYDKLELPAYYKEKYNKLDDFSKQLVGIHYDSFYDSIYACQGTAFVIFRKENAIFSKKEKTLLTKLVRDIVNKVVKT